MERNDQVRNSHLVTPNKITNLGTDHKEMLRSESEVAQSCLTLCNPMDCSLSGSSSMGFSRQECWSGLPFPSPGDLPDPGIEPRSPALQADALPSEPPGKPIPDAKKGRYKYRSPVLEMKRITSLQTLQTVNDKKCLQQCKYI